MFNPSLLPRHGSRTADDSLIPLINIVFLLLIFFMVGGQIAQQQDPAISPPSSASRLALEPAKVELAMNSAGALTLDGQPVDAAALAQRITSLAAEETDIRVALRADRDATAADLDTVFTQLRDLGVNTITLHTLYTEAE
ncbi:ExbD/TolR family protein [Pseudomonas saliphila]|uniref:ExbD/TolR family protein n=1 Tax=Pseudomonas saliphila TaxID=2586906 RepID=UPI001239FC75|nr:biopolymer transporter ExbD [Pseudomonas saliphila]